MPENLKSSNKALIGFWIRLVCFALIIMCLLVYGSYVLTPKEDYGICPMTNLYVQPRNTVDVLVLGSSLAYSGCNTTVLWRTRGIASYNLCGAEEPYWEIYYQLREALRLQRPQLIVLDAKAAAYPRDYSSRSRTIQHTFGILNPLLRTEAIFGCQEDAGDALEFVLAYPQIHNRYDQLTASDFSWPPTNGGRGSYWKGYIENDMATPQLPPRADTTEVRSLGQRSEEYLRKIFELAKAENIPVLLVSFPYPDYDDDAKQIMALWKIAEECNIPYIDYNHVNVGLEYASDFADGQHLNVRGSMKVSVRLAEDIAIDFHIPDRRGDPAYASYDAYADTWMDKLYDYLTSPMMGEFDL